MNPYMEIEIYEKGTLLFDEQTNSTQRMFIMKYGNQIIDLVGGMLCEEHYQIPKCESKYVNRRWVVSVTTCCDDHLDKVQTRLDEYYKK